MFSLDGYRPVDLSPRIKPRVHRVDGSLEEGGTDPYGTPWIMHEGVFPGDNSLFTLYAAPEGDETYHQERLTSHNGAHVQGGKGHISHWPGMPDDMLGLWEMPLETFVGEAAVCYLDNLSPQPLEHADDYPRGVGWRMQSEIGDIRGIEILPKHLSAVKEGDIVLMSSPFERLEQPWLSNETAKWLVQDRKIRMLGLEASGVDWQYDLKLQPPNNSPVRRTLLSANVPIAHPLVNIESLSADRVLYFGLPFNFEKFEASFIRAVAFEPKESNR